jgi:hypothetical protein
MKWIRYIATGLCLATAVWWTWAADDLSLSYGDTDFKTAREADDKERPSPTWPVDPDFKGDLFHFARLQYTAQHAMYGRGHTDAEKRWLIDFPACDLDLSYRLHQMTSVKVDPDGRVVKLSDTNLFNYPFLYLIEPGRGFLTEPEIPILRKYLLNGGFLMVDDFWGEREWKNFADEIQRLFPADKYPNQKISDLPIEHPVFHTVFDLKEKPQVPGIPHFVRWGRSHERDQEGEEVHYRGIHDDKGRLIMLICHNTDLGDGWEREGDNEEYFRKFSEPKAFPMGINAIVYAMTH